MKCRSPPSTTQNPLSSAERVMVDCRYQTAQANCWFKWNAPQRRQVQCQVFLENIVQHRECRNVSFGHDTLIYDGMFIVQTIPIPNTTREDYVKLLLNRFVKHHIDKQSQWSAQNFLSPQGHFILSALNVNKEISTCNIKSTVTSSSQTTWECPIN